MKKSTCSSCCLCCELTGDPENPLPTIGGGVYALVEDGVVDYVGSSLELSKRKLQWEKKRMNAKFVVIHRWDGPEWSLRLLEFRYQQKFFSCMKNLNKFDGDMLFKSLRREGFPDDTKENTQLS